MIVIFICKFIRERGKSAPMWPRRSEPLSRTCARVCAIALGLTLSFALLPAHAGAQDAGVADASPELAPDVFEEPDVPDVPDVPDALLPEEPPPEEVTVYVSRTPAQELQQSAEAVHVIDTRKARRQTADLGEVLARTQGVAVRREGGLGSGSRFSLNGLYDDQIRFFLDGVPLDIAGFPFGVANVPVNFVERVEIYRGVVPVRFGADALGGVVHLVSSRNYETHVGASYQVGSFGTHRAT